MGNMFHNLRELKHQQNIECVNTQSLKECISDCSFSSFRLPFLPPLFSMNIHHLCNKKKRTCESGKGMLNSTT